MNACVLHGENQPASRKKLAELLDSAKKRGVEVVLLEWNPSTRSARSGPVGLKGKLLNAAQSQAMFSSLKTVVVENFFSNNKQASEILKELEGSGSDLIFWEGKAVPSGVLSKLDKGFQVFEFKLPVLTFKFLDSVRPGNAKNSLEYLSKMDKEEADFLLIMLARHTRSLIWVKEDPSSLKLAAWQKSNLEKQALKFTTEELYALHGNLLKLDRMNKKSQLVGNLMENLEELVTTL